MRFRKRIHFSRRDPGSVGHIVAILRFFNGIKNVGFYVTSSGLALDMLAGEGCTPIAFLLSNGNDFLVDDKYPTLLISEARELLERITSNTVFTSSSTLALGVDEGLVAVVKRLTFFMQYFWGGVNLGLGESADLYFCIDDEAVKLTESR